MAMRSFSSLLILVFGVTVLAAGGGHALAADGQEKFYGSYVGSGTAKRVLR